MVEQLEPNGPTDRWTREGLRETDAIKCRWCGQIMRATVTALIDHCEKYIVLGETILVSPCEAKRVSDGSPALKSLRKGER